MEIEIIEEEEIIAGWKTDTVSIEWVSTERIADQNVSVGTHLLILFIPGNPGCVRWYIPMLQSIVEQLIEGGHHKAISVRGVSYAGHGVGLDKLQKISEPGKREDGLSHIDAHSVNGQIEHKIRWIDRILKVSGRPIEKIVFISHSIGSHLVQRICVLRLDILFQVVTVLHLMPFIRFDPSLASQRIPLSFVAHAATTSDPRKLLLLPLLEAFSHISSRLPPHLLDYILLHGAGVVDKKGRYLASELVVQPAMARNFFTLGCEEIRDLPEYFDDCAFRIIGNHCPIAMLYCGGPDQWAPDSHRVSLQKLQDIGVIPKNDITIDYYPNLKHDFIVQPHMVPTVVNFCVRKILVSSYTAEENNRENSIVLYYDFPSLLSRL